MRRSRVHLRSCLSLLLLSALAVRAQAWGQWVSHPGNLGASVINYVYFFDDWNGVVGGKGKFIRYTIDGGDQWRKPILPPSFAEVKDEDDIIDGSVVNGRHGRTLYLLTYKRLLRSNNNGESWGELPDPASRLRGLIPANIDVQYKDVAFVSDSRGWLLCRVFKAQMFFRSYVLQTNDAGQTWQPTEVGPPDRRGQPYKRMFRMHFSDSGKGWVVGENGTILYTNNGGRSWDTQPYPLREGEKDSGSRPTLVDIDCKGKRCIVIGDQGAVLRLDDGRQWFRMPYIKARPATLVFRRLEMVDEEQALIVGDAGAMFWTTDGGNSWKQQGSDTGAHLYAIFMCNRQLGWTAGDKTFLKYDGRRHYRPSGGGFGAPTGSAVRPSRVTCHD